MADKSLKLKCSQTKAPAEQINYLLPLKYLISLLNILEIFKYRINNNLILQRTCATFISVMPKRLLKAIK